MGDVREELNRLAERVELLSVGDWQRDQAERDAIAKSLRALSTRRVENALSARAAVPEGDDRVLWGVVANAARMSDRRGMRWSHVVDATGLGSQSSIALCRRFGFDPDENVGGCEEGDEDAAAPQPAGEAVPRNDLVPGVMRCAKCEFQLHRVTLYVRSGTAGAGDSDTEPCPNGCGPLWPVTWRQWAEEAQEYAQRLRDELDALKTEPGPSAPADLASEYARGRSDGWDAAMLKCAQAPAEAVKDCLTTAEVEALATKIAHTFDRDEDGKGWVFDSAQLAEFACRLSGARQAGVLEALNETDKDIALAQAVEFAQYVVDHAKGRMVEAAERFLSLPYSREVAGRLVQAQQAAKDGA